jgi:hypothetical protein
MHYNITIARTGCVNVEADSAEEAMFIANNLKEQDISWTDDWNATDCETIGDDGCGIHTDKFAKAKMILSAHDFLYEETPNGKLEASPQNIPMKDSVIKELGSAGYFTLPSNGNYIISRADGRKTFVQE